MEQMLYIREGILNFYKRYEIYVLFLAKFIIGFIVFNLIGGMGYASPDLNLPTIPGIPVNFALGLLYAVLPRTVSYMLMIAYIALQSSAVPEIALVITLVMICFLVFYVRLAPRESILIVLTILAYFLRIPYFAPLFAGLYFGLTAVVPVTIGVFIWNSAPIVSSLLATTKSAGFDIMEIPTAFSSLYVEIMNSLSANNQWILFAFIFAMTIIVVNASARLSIDYSKDIAVLLGATVMIVSFVISMLISGMNLGIFSMIILTIFSAALLLVIRFFDCVLDYSRVERVEFEDEENYYYVKIVPKVLLAKRNRVVRRIRPTPEDFEE